MVVPVFLRSIHYQKDLLIAVPNFLITVSLLGAFLVLAISGLSILLYLLTSFKNAIAQAALTVGVIKQMLTNDIEKYPIDDDRIIYILNYVTIQNLSFLVIVTIGLILAGSLMYFLTG